MDAHEILEPPIPKEARVAWEVDITLRLGNPVRHPLEETTEKPAEPADPEKN